MIEIDGSIGEGGGQILRTSMSLSAICGIPVKIKKIRAGRREPGLRPQHLQAVLAAVRLCNGNVKGASVGSSELEFIPGVFPKEFNQRIDTGTAGSVTLIAQTLIPISIFGNVDLDIEIVGGTEVPQSPTTDYLIEVVLPIYRMLGGDVTIDLMRRGYYPRGGGSIRVRSKRSSASRGLFLAGKNSTPKILSASRLLPDHVARRQLESALKKLSGSGQNVVESIVDCSGASLSPGSSILIFTKSGTSFVGASSLGERGRRAEQVGEEAADSYLREISCNPGIDSHLSDMLATLLPCVDGKSEYTIPFVTDHLKTNIMVVKQFIPDSSFEILTPQKQQEKSPGSCYTIRVNGGLIRKA